MVENDFPIGAALINILAIEDHTFAGNELCLDQVEFIFETRKIVLKAVMDTDEIEILQAPVAQLTEATSSDWGRSLIGKKLQTFWICENAQGYQDQVIFAFEQLHPTLTFLAEGSVLKAFQSQPIQKRQKSSTHINEGAHDAILSEDSKLTVQLPPEIRPREH